MDRVHRLRDSYDRVAEEYVRHIYDELKGKPLDRELLDRFVTEVGGSEPVCDMGCGPGQVARYLHDRGANVAGVDLSPGMIAWARKLNPGIEFRVGDMTALEDADATWAGIAAFYSIVHFPRDQVVHALRELHRVLRPHGLLLLAFHIGDETLHRDEWWGHEVSVDWYFFTAEEIAAGLRAAGFTIEQSIEREPYPEVEHPSRRAYIFARAVK
jgi:SAM-dependent methyltransferase